MTPAEAHRQSTLHLAGYPRSLSSGRELVVEDLEGRGIIDRSKVTLTLDDSGRVV
jgi:hypothetical protein